MKKNVDIIFSAENVSHGLPNSFDRRPTIEI